MNYPELAQAERKRLWGRLFIRTMILVAAILFIFLLIPTLFNNFFPFIAAFVVAWLFHPIIKKIREKIPVSRKILSLLFTILLFVVAGALITWLCYAIINEFLSFVSSLSEGGMGLSGTTSSEGFLSGLLAVLPDGIRVSIESAFVQITEWIRESMSGFLSSITSRAGSFISSIPSFFISLVVFLTALYFISADYPKLRSSMGKHLTGEPREFMRLLRSPL